MVHSRLIFEKLMLATPVVIFLAVIDSSAWPLLLLIACPVLLAHYRPLSLWTGEKSKKRFPLLHLALAGAVILTLNISPKKEQKSICKQEYAVEVPEKAPGVDFVKPVIHCLTRGGNL